MMFIRLLFTSICLFIVVQSTITNNLKDKSSSSLMLPKSYPLNDDDYYLNDKKSNDEGSGGIANLEEYEDEYDQLPKIISTTTPSPTTTKRIITKLLEQKSKNENNAKNNYIETNEFYDDYKDDVEEDDASYNELTTKTTSVSLTSTRPTSATQRHRSFRTIVNFLTRPPIAAGILGGLAIGILTSVILLICIVQNFQKRDGTHSSYTTGLLYPNQYGYTKTPQEFYA